MSAASQALAITELLSLIISELDQPSLAAASLVNRTWRKEAQLVMYFQPELYSEPDDWHHYVPRLEQLCATLEARRDLAAKVRQLGLFAYIKDEAPEEAEKGNKLEGYELIARLLGLCKELTHIDLEGLTDWVAADLLTLLHAHTPAITALTLARTVTGADWQYEEPLTFATVAPLLLPFARLTALDLVEVDIPPTPLPPTTLPTFQLTSLVHRAPPLASALPRAPLAWLLSASHASLDILALDACASDTLDLIASLPSPIDTVTLTLSLANFDSDLARLLAIARRPKLTLLGLDMEAGSDAQQEALWEAVDKLHDELGRVVVMPMTEDDEESEAEEEEAEEEV